MKLSKYIVGLLLLCQSMTSHAAISWPFYGFQAAKTGIGLAQIVTSLRLLDSYKETPGSTSTWKIRLACISLLFGPTLLGGTVQATDGISKTINKFDEDFIAKKKNTTNQPNKKNIYLINSLKVIAALATPVSLVLTMFAYENPSYDSKKLDQHYKAAYIGALLNFIDGTYGLVKQIKNDLLEHMDRRAQRKNQDTKNLFI